ncbi:Peptidyl-prolyl cis-trans isomerase pin4 [Dinochytrium kinnereticum]|nr:Peptidyl-prolyl cis-trans isomerase pin4 [Dinochytrium kinnereticum]
MPPKKKGDPGKGKGGAKEAKGEGSGGKGELKSANAVKVRHILCEKHARIMEAMAKLKEEKISFNKVAEEYSEDKAKAGGSLGWMPRGSMVIKPVPYSIFLTPLTSNLGDDYDSEEDHDWKPGSDDDEDDDEDHMDEDDADNDADDKIGDVDESAASETQSKTSEPNGDGASESSSKTSEAVTGTKRKRKSTLKESNEIVSAPRAKRAKKASATPKKATPKQEEVSEDENGDSENKKVDVGELLARDFILGHFAIPKPVNPIFPIRIFTEEFEDFLSRRASILEKSQKDLQTILPRLTDLDSKCEIVKKELVSEKKKLKETVEELDQLRVREIAMYSVMAEFFFKLLGETDEEICGEKEPPPPSIVPEVTSPAQSTQPPPKAPPKRRIPPVRMPEFLKLMMERLEAATDLSTPALSLPDSVAAVWAHDASVERGLERVNGEQGVGVEKVDEVVGAVNGEGIANGDKSGLMAE